MLNDFQIKKKQKKNTHTHKNSQILKDSLNIT